MAADGEGSEAETGSDAGASAADSGSTTNAGEVVSGGSLADETDAASVGVGALCSIAASGAETCCSGTFAWVFAFFAAVFFLAAAVFFLAGAFFLAAAVFFLAGAFFLTALLTGFGSSGCSSRVKPSRSARRRSMSAYASCREDEGALAATPAAPARSSTSLLVIPSSLASSWTRIFFAGTFRFNLSLSSFPHRCVDQLVRCSSSRSAARMASRSGSSSFVRHARPN